MKVNVATYNVLGDEAAMKSGLITEKPWYLSYEHRLPLLRDRILTLMKNNYIICLQEVSAEFLYDIGDLFEENKYTYVTPEVYEGTTCVTLYPNSKYEMIEGRSVRVGDYIMEYLPGLDKDDVSVVRALQHKKQLIITSFRSTCSGTNKIFCVANYHMPVAYRDYAPSHMHARTLLKIFEQLEMPVILAGDLNCTPISSTFRLFTTIMTPAYTREGSRTFASTNVKYKSGPFRGLIDYILVTNEFRVYDYRTGDTRKIMPNETEGSDHTHVRATVSL